MDTRPTSPSRSPPSPGPGYSHTRARATSQSDTTKAINGASKLSISTGPRGRAVDEEESGSGSGSGSGSTDGLRRVDHLGSDWVGPKDVPFPNSRSTTPTPRPTPVPSSSRRNSRVLSTSMDVQDDRRMNWGDYDHDRTTRTSSSLPTSSPFHGMETRSNDLLRVPAVSLTRKTTDQRGPANGERRRSSTSHIPMVGTSSFYRNVASSSSASFTHYNGPNNGSQHDGHAGHQDIPIRHADSGGEGISPRWWNGRTTSYSRSPTIPHPSGPGSVGRPSSPGPSGPGMYGHGQGRPLPPSRTTTASTSGLFTGPPGIPPEGSGRSSPAFGGSHAGGSGNMVFRDSPATYGPAMGTTPTTGGGMDGVGSYEFDPSTFDARRHPFPPVSNAGNIPSSSSASHLPTSMVGGHGRRGDRVSRISEVVEPDSPRVRGWDRQRSSEASTIEEDEPWDVFREVERERERVVSPPSIAHLVPPLTSSLTSLSLALTTRQRSIQHTLQEYKSLAERFLQLDDEIIDGVLGSLVLGIGSATRHGDKVMSPSSSGQPTGSDQTNTGQGNEPPAVDAHTNLSVFLRTIEQTRSAVDGLEGSLREKESVMHGVEDELARLVPQILSELDRRIEDRRTSIERVQAERLRRERIIFIGSIVGSVLVLLCGMMGMWYTRSTLPSPSSSSSSSSSKFTSQHST